MSEAIRVRPVHRLTMASASGLVVVRPTPCIGVAVRVAALNRSRLPVQPDGYARGSGQLNGGRSAGADAA